MKKLYFQLSDGIDIVKVVQELSGAMTWIEEDMKEYSELTDDIELPVYTLEPIWLTDEEYENLPEANL